MEKKKKKKRKAIEVKNGNCGKTPRQQREKYYVIRHVRLLLSSVRVELFV
jgi:hypothetical protein